MENVREENDVEWIGRKRRKEGDVKDEGRRVRRWWKEGGRRWRRKTMRKVRKERKRKNA